jgi:hypothetical protein
MRSQLHHRGGFAATYLSADRARQHSTPPGCACGLEQHATRSQYPGAAASHESNRDTRCFRHHSPLSITLTESLRGRTCESAILIEIK